MSNRPLTYQELLNERVVNLELYAQTLGSPDEILSRIKKLEDKVFLCKDIFTSTEAAEYLGLARSTLYKMTSLGDIPFFRKGKFVYFEREQLDHWLLNGHRNQNADAVKELLNKK